MDSCIFCKIVQKQAPATIEYENDDVICFRNIAPVAQTHILIVPKIHIDSFATIDGATIAALTKGAQELINKLGIGGAYKLVVNGGKYQSVPHFHWHLLAGKLENEDDILHQT